MLSNPMAAALAAAAALVGAAHATPFVVAYTIAEQAEGYRYDITVTLDDNDGSWMAGQAFDFFTFGNQLLSEDPGGAFSDPEFLSAPVGAQQLLATGGANGPAVCFTACDAAQGGYAPAAVGDAFTLAVFASALIGPGDFLWSNLSATGDNGAIFTAADFQGFVSETPLPAAALLFLCGLFTLTRSPRRGA